MEPLLIVIPILIIVAIVNRLAAASMDGARVERYVKEMGRELLDKSWEPFGPDRYGERAIGSPKSSIAAAAETPTGPT